MTMTTSRTTTQGSAPFLDTPTVCPLALPSARSSSTCRRTTVTRPLRARRGRWPGRAPVGGCRSRSRLRSRRARSGPPVGILPQARYLRPSQPDAAQRRGTGRRTVGWCLPRPALASKSVAIRAPRGGCSISDDQSGKVSSLRWRIHSTEGTRGRASRTTVATAAGSSTSAPLTAVAFSCVPGRRAGCQAELWSCGRRRRTCTRPKPCAASCLMKVTSPPSTWFSAGPQT